MDVAVDDIKGAIRFAKREVWLSNAPLILRPSLDGKNWSKGIQLWEDDGTHANSLTVTHHYEWHLKGVHITWHGFQANDYLLFTRELSQNTLNGYFVIENDTGKRVLVVNRLGRVREKF